ncbi:MAG: hypothetical protein M1449_10535 [Candidatus Thermoplasmatota archaeon]|nr:hypothetical protein [Candidatus Thermoplasmatota archaeon]
MRIALVTPYGREHRNGNWHTAARWARFLREAGHTVRTQVEWDGRSADLMLALHGQPVPAAARQRHGLPLLRRRPGLPRLGLQGAVARDS